PILTFPYTTLFRSARLVVESLVVPAVRVSRREPAAREGGAAERIPAAARPVGGVGLRLGGIAVDEARPVDVPVGWRSGELPGRRVEREALVEVRRRQ